MSPVSSYEGDEMDVEVAGDSMAVWQANCRFQLKRVSMQKKLGFLVHQREVALIWRPLLSILHKYICKHKLQHNADLCSRSQPTRREPTEIRDNSLMKTQQKNNSGLGLGIACTQRLDFSCHWQTDGVVWQWTGKHNDNGQKCSRSYGRQPCFDTTCW